MNHDNDAGKAPGGVSGKATATGHLPAHALDAATIEAMAEALIDVHDRATTLAPPSGDIPGFDVEAGYAVLAAIERRRIEQGWQRAGRKIGFTNRTLWRRYGVWQPMVASVWTGTVHHARDGEARLALQSFVQPRIEPEVVFGLRAPVAPDADAATVLAASAWIAAGFEIVQSHFPRWRFAAADCTAAFGLHGALVVGTPWRLDDGDRADLVARLPTFEATLRRDGEVIDRGVGANVLDSPALAIAHAAAVLAAHPALAPLAAGELVTTGTLTDAWPLKPGETWSSDYGTLGLRGLTLHID
jgi:2-oxo-3-hexenedioate decarboxylase